MVKRDRECLMRRMDEIIEKLRIDVSADVIMCTAEASGSFKYAYSYAVDDVREDLARLALVYEEYKELIESEEK